MDAAMTELYDEKTGLYTFHKSSGKQMTTDELVSYWTDWTKKYPIISIEDGLAEDDWAGWAALNKAIGHTTQLVGDDLFVTNVSRVERGIKEGSANSVLVKVNQIGSLTETVTTVQKAQRNGMTCIMSHRSGETEDSTIADLAVALNTGQIKTGSASRSDRMAKYNQLLPHRRDARRHCCFQRQEFQINTLMDRIKEHFATKIPMAQADVKAFLAEHGEKKIGEITVEPNLSRHARHASLDL